MSTRNEDLNSIKDGYTRDEIEYQILKCIIDAMDADR